MSPTIRIVLGVLSVFSISSGVMAQTNVTAKNTTPATRIPAETDRSRDGLSGPVRRVRTEIVKLTSQDGRMVEGKRSLLEVVAYDVNGKKIENQYFPITSGTLTGKEVYKYDDKGNISEMTLLNEDGSLMSKEIYKYEFDFAGNWNKMTTAVAVFDGGKISFEPTEVTYRSIMYYLDESLAKMVQPSAQPTMPASASVTEPARTQPASSDKSNSKTGPVLPNSKSSDRMGGANMVDVKSMGSTTGAVVILDSEPPPTPAPASFLRPISGGVLNGTALSLPSPTYPEAARRMRVAGTVSVTVVLDETGKVISAEATSGPVQLRQTATMAALRARFSPTKLSGQPVKVTGTINYKFSLP